MTHNTPHPTPDATGRSFGLAGASWCLGEPGPWAAFEARLDALCREARAGGADLLFLPEYAGLEAAATLPQAIRLPPAALFQQLQPLLPRFRQLHQDLAKAHRLTLIAGSLPVAVSPEQYLNRSYLYTPNGHESWQDKLIPTPYERRTGLIVPGTEQKVWQTPLGPIAIVICYDSEFPLLVRQVVSAGARLILVPSCTDTLAGYYRVHLSCRARALENQVLVAHVPLLGGWSWCDFVDQNRGAAALCTPVDQGCPDDGLLAQSPLDQPGLLHARVDLALLEHVRRHGHVANDADWSRQHTLPPVQVQSMA